MASRTIRLEFISPNDNWQHTHDLPIALLPAQATHTAPINQLLEHFRGIANEHRAECNDRRAPHCATCNQASTQIALTMEFRLHVENDPHVRMLVEPTCGTAVCNVNATARTKQKYDVLFRTIESTGPKEPACKVGEIHVYELYLRRALTLYKVCGTYEDLKQCAKRKVVFYCSVKHQKLDWKEHKKVCRAPGTTESSN